jgi:zinc protease
MEAGGERHPAPHADPAHRMAIRALAEILQTRLLETIREELGGTYSVNATAGYERIPNQTYSIAIQFGSAPDRTENLIKRVFQEIELLKTNGPTDKQVSDEKEALLREYETNSKVNNFWLAQITAKYQSGEDPVALWHLPELYNKIDKAMIQQAAKTYLNTNAYVEVMLFPEKK